MDTFLFLYPHEEIFEVELEFGHAPHAEYRRMLNACIDERYRRKGFRIAYLVLDDEPVSPIIELRRSDRIIPAGMDAATHRTKRPDGTYPYPIPHQALDALLPARLRLGGFHLWDCVERMARAAHGRGIDTLVDEDLTEFFACKYGKPWFRIGEYPSYDPRADESDGWLLEDFLRARAGKPWMWQEYR